MGLALWRFDEYGASQEAGHFSTRFGRRQNALLGVRNTITNGVLNPYFRDNLQYWTAFSGVVAQSRTIRVPFGTGAVELSRTDSTATTFVFLRQKQLVADAIASSGLFRELPSNWTYAAHVSAYFKGVKGSIVTLRLLEDVVSGYNSGELSFTLTKDNEWERFSAEVFVSGEQVDTTLHDYAVDVGISGAYKGPVYVTAIQVAGDVNVSPPFVYEGYGSIREPFSNGGGDASFTQVYVPVPGDLIGAVGALAFWQQVEGLHGYQDWLFKFKTAIGGANAAVGSGTVNDVWGAYLRNDISDNVELVISLPKSNGDANETLSFSLGVKVDELVGEWGHFLIQWNNGSIIASYNGVPLRKLVADSGGHYFTRSPGVVIFMSDRDDVESQQAVGLQEGFTIYNRNFTPQDVEYFYRHGDNLVTGAIAHLSLHGDVVLEVGDAIGFEGPGDYRVSPSGYAPGTSVGQPTVRFDSGDDEGPYIVQERYPRILEPIKFEVMNNDPDGVAKKLSNLNRVLQRSGSGQSLVIQYAPIGSNINLRAKVSGAYLSIPPEWTSIAQIANVLKGLTIDLERDQYSSGRRSLGVVMVPRAIPHNLDTTTVPYGVVYLPPVDGNLPAPMTVSVEHSVDRNGDVDLIGQPNTLTLALRRRKSLETPLYCLSTLALDLGLGAPSYSGTELNGGHIVLVNTEIDLPIVGEFERIGTWDADYASTDVHTDLSALTKVSNYGTYRVFIMAKATGPIDLQLTIGDASYTGTVDTEEWNMVDLGAVTYPGKSVLRPQSNRWTTNKIFLSASRVEEEDDFLHIAGVFFMPIEDGFVQSYSSVIGEDVTYLDSKGNVSNTGLLAAYVAGLVLSSSVPTEVRGYSLESLSSTLYEAWSHHNSELRLNIEYMPTYTGLGDE